MAPGAIWLAVGLGSILTNAFQNMSDAAITVDEYDFFL